jgi:ATP-dependent protease ClpP protease subunit
MFKVIAGLVASMLVSVTAQAGTLDVDTSRLIRIEGEVNESILPAADAVVKLAAESTSPIYVLINSGGGDVLAGLQFVSAIKAAQSLGVRVRCFVPNIAMSMAFVILSECSERYALKYSLLLFHPMRISLMGSYKADDLADFSNGLSLLEEPLIRTMIRKTGLPRAMFLRNYKAETIWTAETFKLFSPKFLKIVDSFGAATFGEVK